MTPSLSAVSSTSPKADWTALTSCLLASFLFLSVFGLFGWLVASQDQVFHWSDAVHAAVGIDLLWLFSLVVVVGTPTALLLGGGALYRTRESRGRKGRVFALLGVVFSLSIVAFLAYLFFTSPPLKLSF